MVIKKLMSLGLVLMFFSFGCKDDSDTDICEKNVDYDLNGTVTAADFSVFLRLFEDKDSKADLNCDGKFDEHDALIFEDFLRP